MGIKNTLDSVEVFDPETNTRRAGTTLPVTHSSPGNLLDGYNNSILISTLTISDIPSKQPKYLVAVNAEGLGLRSDVPVRG